MSYRSALLAVVFWSALPTPSIAQSGEFTFTRSELRELVGPASPMEFVHNVNGPVDLNGDGVDDFVGGGYFVGGTVRVSSGGRFEDISRQFRDVRIADLLADWNSDGRLDLVGLSAFGQPVFLLDDGLGGYARVPSGSSYSLPFFNELVGAVDLDGAGVPELLVETQADLIVVRVVPSPLGAMTPSSFELSEVARVQRPTPIFFGPQALLLPIDFDRDGDPDLIDGTAQIYENDGAGLLSLGPRLGSFNRIPIYVSQPTVVFDINGDGIDDYANTAIYLGIAAGGFVSRAVRPDGYAVAARDLNGDGHTDLVWVRRDQSIEILIQGGAGPAPSFQVGQALQPGPNGAFQLLEIGDFDGEGDLDMIFQGYGRRTLMLNDGRGSFSAAGSGILDRDSRVVAAGDFDGDGVTDLMAQASPGVLRGVREELRFESLSVSRFFGVLRNARPGDIDGDGDLDLVGERVWINDGTGLFTDETSSRLFDPLASQGVDLRDLDGDGDLDRIAYKSEFSRLFRNDGNGVFAEDSSAFPAVPRDVRDGAILDIDGDGDLDLVVCDSGVTLAAHGVVQWIQGVNGQFVERPLPLNSAAYGPCGTATAGDIDRDGDDDVVASSSLGLLILENRNGVLFASRPNGSATVGGRLSLADLDGDGALDLIGDRLYLNDGRGRFTDQTSTLVDLRTVFDQGTTAIIPPMPGVTPLVVDLEEDGDLDLIWPGPETTLPVYNQPPRVATNRYVQLSLDGLSMRGAFLNYRVDAAIGRTQGPRSATLLIAAGPGSMQIGQVGELRLELATLSNAGSISIPAFELSGRFALPIPGDPALQGLEVWSQAVITDPFGVPRLTGAVKEVIR